MKLGGSNENVHCTKYSAFVSYDTMALWKSGYKLNWKHSESANLCQGRPFSIHSSSI